MLENELFDNHIWSDSWCVEERHIWFMGGDVNILFKKEEGIENVEIVSVISCEKLFMMRQNPICMKLGDAVYALPNNGDSIWIYHIMKDYWSRIIVNNPKGERLSCSKAWVLNEILYVVSIGLKQIIEVDIVNEVIIKYYNISELDQSIGESVLVDNCIYIIGYTIPAVYKFDCISKEIYKYELIIQDDHINRICYDGEKFWLCGGKGKIYIWHGNSNVEIIDSFPDDFGIYNFDGIYSDIPLFISVVSVGEYIWFIPFKTNNILYTNKKSWQLNVFYVENEMQDEDSLKTQLLQHKYLLEYVKEDRYIGIYSLKNRWIIEIDSKELKYRIIKYKLSRESIFKINSLIIDKIKLDNGIIWESNSVSLEKFVIYLQNQCDDSYAEKYLRNMPIGKNIFDVLF